MFRVPIKFIRLGPILHRQFFLAEHREHVTDVAVLALDPPPISALKSKAVEISVSAAMERFIQVFLEKAACCSRPRNHRIPLIRWQQSLDESLVYDDLRPFPWPQCLAGLRRPKDCQGLLPRVVGRLASGSVAEEIPESVDFRMPPMVRAQGVISA